MAERRLTRRQFVAVSSAVFTAALAGCSDDETEDVEPVDPDETNDESDDDLPWTDE